MMNKQIQINQLLQLLSDIKDERKNLTDLESLYSHKIKVLRTPDKYKIGQVLREKGDDGKYYLSEIVSIGSYKGNGDLDWNIMIHLYDENNEPIIPDQSDYMDYRFAHIRIVDETNADEFEITDIPGKCHLLSTKNIVFA